MLLGLKKKDNIFLLCFENQYNLSLPTVEKNPKNVENNLTYLDCKY